MGAVREMKKLVVVVFLKWIRYHRYEKRIGYIDLLNEWDEEMRKRISLGVISNHMLIDKMREIEQVKLDDLHLMLGWMR